jgi:hypothetical protein
MSAYRTPAKTNVDPHLAEEIEMLELGRELRGESSKPIYVALASLSAISALGFVLAPLVGFIFAWFVLPFAFEAIKAWRLDRRLATLRGLAEGAGEDGGARCRVALREVEDDGGGRGDDADGERDVGDEDVAARGLDGVGSAGPRRAA